VRCHWAIENTLHWSLDVSFAEDQCRVRSGYAAENLAILRHMSLNILKGETTKKRGIKGKQKNAGWDHSYLLKLLRILMRKPCLQPSRGYVPHFERSDRDSRPGTWNEQPTRLTRG
jgi:hypothetical protein